MGICVSGYNSESGMKNYGSTFLNCCFSGYNSESRMTGCGSGSLDVASKLVDDHHFPPCQVQGEMMTKTQLQDCSIFENKF